MSSKNLFYVWQVEKKYVRLRLPKLSLCSSLDNAAIWFSKEHVNSWKRNILRKYPKAKLKTAVLKIKK